MDFYLACLSIIAITGQRTNMRVLPATKYCHSNYTFRNQRIWVGHLSLDFMCPYPTLIQCYNIWGWFLGISNKVDPYPVSLENICTVYCWLPIYLVPRKTIFY